jgi:hypothetical protein
LAVSSSISASHAPARQTVLTPSNIRFGIANFLAHESNKQIKRSKDWQIAINRVFVILRMQRA